MIQRLMMCNKRAYPCLRFCSVRDFVKPQFAWQHCLREDENFSGHVIPFRQLHKSVIHLFFFFYSYANCVYERSRRLVCWLLSPVHKTSTQVFVLLSLHTHAGQLEVWSPSRSLEKEEEEKKVYPQRAVLSHPICCKSIIKKCCWVPKMAVAANRRQVLLVM